jgi:hypothetical protein
MCGLHKWGRGSNGMSGWFTRRAREEIENYEVYSVDNQYSIFSTIVFSLKSIQLIIRYMIIKKHEEKFKKYPIMKTDDKEELENIDKKKRAVMTFLTAYRGRLGANLIE